MMRAPLAFVNLSTFRRTLALAAPVVMLAVGSAQPALAAPHDTAKGKAKAQAVILRRLSFIKVQDLDFGHIVPAATAGTVVLAPDGTRTTTGAVRAVGGNAKPAIFAGYGDFLGNVTIRMNANTTTLTRVGGTQTMTMDTFIIGSTPQQQLTTTIKTFYIGSSSGMFTFPVGATLRVNANQAPGTYTGTFSITLNYQ